MEHGGRIIMHGVFNKRSKQKMTLAGVISSIPQSLELASSQLRLDELRERRDELQVKIQEAGGRLGRVSGHAVSRLDREIRTLHGERELLEAEINLARRERDELLPVWRQQVQEAAAPLLLIDARRGLELVEELQAIAARFASVAIEHPWLVQAPIPLCPPPLASWRACFRRFVDPGCIE
jgi:hypothetical protein